jgi:hypothetical protein
LLALAQPACSGSEGSPKHLVDGTSAETLSIALNGVAGRQIATKVTHVAPRDVVVDSIVARCLDADGEYTPLGPVVSRVGVEGASVTFRAASGRILVACDGGTPGTTASRPWCGRGVGRVHRKRLLDPRLDLVGCVTAGGDPVAFAWIEPSRRARYVTVHRRGFVEAYPVSGHLPVRVATTADIDLESSSATFEISEHDRNGHMLRAYTLEARVAG